MSEFTLSGGARRWLAPMTLLLIASLGLFACKTSPRVPGAQPMPQGKTFDGVWYSPQFEHMYVVQDGDTVRGIYAYRTGGEFEGTVNGNLLTFSWTDPGDREKARRSFKGHGYLQLYLDDDKIRLKGQWGYNDDRTGAGPWEAEYVRELDGNDPMTLQQLRDAR